MLVTYFYSIMSIRDGFYPSLFRCEDFRSIFYRDKTIFLTMSAWLAVKGNYKENLPKSILIRLLSSTWVLAALKASHIPGRIKSSMASRSRETILPFFSALMRLHVEPCTQLCNPQHNKNMNLLERVQRRSMKVTRGLELLSYEHRLREKRRLQGDFRAPSST